MTVRCPLPYETYDTVTMAHGGGGRVTHELIRSLLVPAFDNPALSAVHDGAVLPWDGEQLAFTTDSYVVHPRFFPGGNIGHLAVHGTVNDLAMCGAAPVALSLAFVLEEGLPLDELRAIVAAVGDACARLEVPVVTGDTKVVERGKGDGVFINTSGIGRLARSVEIAPHRVRAGDVVLLSGSIAEHGVAILSVREGLEFETRIESDTAPLWSAVERVLGAGGWHVHVLRDATRGGVASALNEIAEASSTGIVLDGAAIPVRDEVRGACELLGLDPLYIANEGRFLAFVAPERAERVLAAMRADPVANGACVVGRVVAEHPGVVRVTLPFGGSRVLDMLSGEQLPRIC